MDIDNFEEEAPPTLPEHDTVSSESSKTLYFDGFVLSAIFYLPDRALDVLLRFMSAFWFVLGSISSACHEIASVFP